MGNLDPYVDYDDPLYANPDREECLECGAVLYEPYNRCSICGWIEQEG